MGGDEQLLRKFAEDGSEDAFTELVRRHIDLVYSTALRVVNGDAHLARDVTQAVFIDLARKASLLQSGVVLEGWLHRDTCYRAATAVRGEQRRKAREQIAMEMRTLEGTESSWEELAPCLDAALEQLRASDRDILVLRYFKRQDFRTVGEALGISEDSAQKRVSRALEKLRAVLKRRGVTLAEATLGSIMATQAVTAAPAGLAAMVTSGTLAAVETGTISTLVNVMASTKLKAGILGAIILGSVVTPLVLRNRGETRVRAQHEILERQARELAALQREHERLSRMYAGAEAAPTAPSAEVLRLRGEVGVLQAAIREFHESTNAPLSRNEVLASMRRMYADRVESLKQQFAENPEEGVPELQYLSYQDWLAYVNYDHHRIDPGQTNRMILARGKAQEIFARNSLQPALKEYSAKNGGNFPKDLSQLIPFFKSPVDTEVLERWTTLSESQVPKHLRVGQDWVITQKAPINAAVDQRFVVGVKMMHWGEGGTQDWARIP